MQWVMYLVWKQRDAKQSRSTPLDPVASSFFNSENAGEGATAAALLVAARPIKQTTTNVGWPHP
jgi:hypothetical protein